jgi:hypothetical protein
MSSTDPASQPFNDLFLANDSPMKPPFYEGKTALIEGHLEPWKGELSTVYSPIFRQSQREAATGSLNLQISVPVSLRALLPSSPARVRLSDGERIPIGVAPQMGEAEALRAVHSAAKAYGHGLGYWSQAPTLREVSELEEQEP